MRKNTRHILIVVVTALLFMSFNQYKIDFFEIAKQIEIYNTLFKEINKSYVDETNPAELMESGVKQMLSELDPYTVYSSEQDVENAKIFQSGTYASVGIKLQLINKKLIITDVIKDHSADLEGLKIGDEIIEIDGVNVSENNLGIETLIGGNKNTNVSIVYSRNGVIKKSVLKRKNRPRNAVALYEILDNNIGYIALERFSLNASKEVESALKFLLIDEVKGIVLDLRNNPGGILQEAVKIVNLFVPKNQLVVSTKSNVEQYNTVFTTQKQPVSLDIPLVVLVNEKSASASEIVAGALQDLDRAVIVGKRSFGKGLVQQSKPLPYGGQIKITISRYYTPSGRCIQALDYSENLKSGVIRKVDEKNRFVSKTKNGRKVYDGGGILPDVNLGKTDELGLYNILKNNNIIFDFVSSNYKSKPLKNIEEFELSANIFKEFKTFCLEKDFDLNTKTELFLKKTLAAAKDEKLTAIKSFGIKINNALKEQKNQALVEIKDQILWGISEEIIRRNFYKEGVYQYAIMNHPAILKAKYLLTNTSDYYKILK